MVVIPAKAGIQAHTSELDSGFRRNDGEGLFSICLTESEDTKHATWCVLVFFVPWW